jgi:hypothetical protein
MGPTIQMKSTARQPAEHKASSEFSLLQVATALTETKQASSAIHPINRQKFLKTQGSLDRGEKSQFLKFFYEF